MKTILVIPFFLQFRTELSLRAKTEVSHVEERKNDQIDLVSFFYISLNTAYWGEGADVPLFVKKPKILRNSAKKSNSFLPSLIL